MAKAKKSSAFYQVKVTYENGKVLNLTFSDHWAAYEACNRANLLPGVKVTEFDSTGFALFHDWKAAMESVAVFCDTDSDMRNAYLRGENPARFTSNKALIDAAQEALKLQEPV